MNNCNNILDYIKIYFSLFYILNKRLDIILFNKDWNSIHLLEIHFNFKNKITLDTKNTILVVYT